MKKFRVTTPRLSALAIAVQAACGVSAWALPQNATVVNGQVTISQPAANTLQVNAGNGAIINWQRFSIGSGELTRFVQPGADSAVLNRVTGGQVSQLLGQLQSNGRVFLINPNGIVIGAGARIDTHSFVASTLDIADADFLAGRLRFLASPGAGGIRNDGVITAGPGGSIALIAPDIVNSGIIQTEGGNILLAAGRSIEITNSDLSGVRFEIQAPTDAVLNLGKLLADNGAVRAFAGTLQNAGVIRAERLVQGSDGSVQLVASGDLTQTAGGSVSASGLSGGQVTLQSQGGTTRVSGTLSASGSEGAGGQVRVLGERVALEAGAVVDASGAAGGGQILVGGDFQGANADVQNAQRVSVAAGATLRADATVAGDGGRVIVWSDENTRFAGALSAQGGALGGNGGFAEVSGKQNLEFTGTANLQAPRGALGNLLLDPLDIVIASGSGILPIVADEFADFSPNAVTIDPAKLNALAANVTLQAERNIYIKDTLTLATAGASLGIQAGGEAWTNGSIFMESLAGRPGGIVTNGGAVTLRANDVVGAGSIATAGGAVDLQVTGALTYDGNITSSGGAVSLTSAGNMRYDGIIQSGGGAVTLTATGGGVYNAQVQAGSGAIAVDGDSGVSGGTFATTGTVSMTAMRGGINSDDITAGVVNLQARDSISAGATVTDRINATSADSNVSLYSVDGGAIRLGTVRAASTVNLDASYGLVQTAGGSIGAPRVSISSYGANNPIGSALAPLTLASASPTRLTLSGLAAPAFVAVDAATELSGLSVSGSVAGIGGLSLTGGANISGWSFGASGGVLNVSGAASQNFSNGFSLTVQDGGANIGSLNLQGGGYLSLAATGAVTLGSVTTTRSSGTGVSVTTGVCTSTYSLCATSAPITIGSINAGTGGVRLTTYDSGDVTATGAISAGSLDVTAGGLYAYTYVYPWGYLWQPTTNRIDLNTVTTTGSVTLTNNGDGNVRVGSLAAGGSVTVNAGQSGYRALSDGTIGRTTNAVSLTTAETTSKSGSFRVTNIGTGDITTGSINRSSTVNLSAAAGAITTGNITSGGSVVLSATGGGASTGVVIGQSSTNLTATGAIVFDSVHSLGSDVNLTSYGGSITTRLDNTTQDVSANTNITIRANDATLGSIGNSALANPMDIRAGLASTITLSAGKDIGAVGHAVKVDTQGTVDITSAGGQYHVVATELGGAGGLRNVNNIRLSASATGVGAGLSAQFNSLNLSLAASSDGTDLFIGDAVTNNLAQSAGTLNAFSFTGLGTTGLRFNDIAFATTGLNQLSLTAGGGLTQALGGIAAGHTQLTATGAVTVGNVAITNQVMNQFVVSSPSDVTTGNVTARGMSIAGGNVTTGSLTSTGTLRGYYSGYGFAPRYGYSDYWTEQMSVSAQGDLSAGNVSSATSALLTAGGNITIGGGTGTVTAGLTAPYYYYDTAKVWGGAAGVVRMGNAWGYEVQLKGGDVQVGDLTGTNVSFTGGAFTARTITAQSGVSVSGTAVTLGATTAAGVTVTADSLAHTGALDSRGNLAITVHGDYTPTYNLAAASQATITADGDINLPQVDSKAGYLTTPRATLTTTAGSGGSINANLIGTTDLTLVADEGFHVTSTAALTDLNITARFDRAATASSSVSTSVLASDQVSYNTQNFFLYNGDGNGIIASGSRFDAAATGWNIRYTDTQDTAVAGGVGLSVSHAQGGNFNLSMASDTDLTSVYVATPSSRAANVNLETGGSINLSDVRTNGGAVTVLSRGRDAVPDVSDAVTGGITVGNVITDVYGTAGNVSLTASRGSIGFDSTPLEVPNRGISTSAQVDATPFDNPGGTVTLRAPLGSIGAGAAIPVAYASGLTLQAKDTVDVSVTGPLGSLSLDVSADAALTGPVRVANSSFVNVSGDAFTGLVLERASGDFRIAGVQGNSAAPGALSVTARDGGIAVTGNVANLSRLTLDAAGGDLLLQAAGGASLSVAATGAMNLTASRDLLIAAGSGAGESVAVTAGTLNLQAGQDLSILADGASATVSTSTGSTSYQTISAGRDFTIRGGTVAGAHANVDFFGGHYQQNVNVGRDFTVQGGSAADAYASFGVRNRLSYQYFDINGNVSIAGGSATGASATVASVVDYQYLYIDGGLGLRAGTGANASAEWAARAGGNSYQSGTIGGDLVVEAGNAGSGQGADAFARFAGGQQRFSNIGGVVRVTGGSASGNYAEISGTGTQELGSTYIYNTGGATEAIAVQGGSGVGAYASIRTNGSQYLYAGYEAGNPTATGDITITGGAGLNARAEIWAGSSQELGSSDSYYYYRPTRSVIVAGGTGQGATATAHAGSSQYIYATETFGVRGGTGSGASAVVEAAGSQEVGSSYGGYYNAMIRRVEVLAGSGGIARVATTGSQQIYTNGDIVVTGGSAAGMTASIESTAGSQTIGTSYNYYGAADPTDNITVQGGTGTGASAFISAATGQTVHAGGAITLSAGASGANAELSTTSGQQNVGHAVTGYSSSYGYYYNNTDSISVTAAPGAYARITTGGTQNLQSAGDIAFTASTGATAQASAGTGQTVLAYGGLRLTGGADSGTGSSATGLLLNASGTQSVTATTGITMTGGTGATDVLISNDGTGSQTVTTSGQLTLQAPGASTGEVFIGSGGNQTVSAGTSIVLDNAAGQSLGLGATGTQTVTAQSMRIFQGGSQAEAFAGLVSGSDQAVVLTGDGATAGSATLNLANANTGAGSTVGIRSGGRLDLTVSDSNYDTAGLVQVGSASGTGRTEITAATDMTIVAGALTIQGGATTAASSAVNAPNAMSISTLYGATQLLAGGGGSASIDPADLNIVSNGTFLMQGGGAAAASSTVTAGNFNLAATQGSLTLQNSAGAATIAATNFNFVGNQAVNLNGGTITVTGAGTVSVPGLCVNCGTNLIGNWTIDAFIPPPIDFVAITASNLMMLTDSLGRTWELITLEDGSVIITPTRRNQCV